ncbi:MAG: M23 family metallopeptidase [Hyphomicrobium sp.]
MRWSAGSVIRFVAVALGAMSGATPSGACEPGTYMVGQKPKLGQPVAGGELSKPFGWQYNHRRNSPDFHNGVDLDVPAGQPVVAALDGEVIVAGTESALGHVVLIDHGNGLRTGYGHMGQLNVAKGACVRAGQVIATSGCSGQCSDPHLHFSILLGDEYVDPGPLLNLYER